MKEPCTAPPGRFCAEGSSDPEGSEDCSVGWYCVGYHFMPQPCLAPPGFFCPEQSSEGEGVECPVQKIVLSCLQGKRRAILHCCSTCVTVFRRDFSALGFRQTSLLVKRRLETFVPREALPRREYRVHSVTFVQASAQPLFHATRSLARFALRARTAQRASYAPSRTGARGAHQTRRPARQILEASARPGLRRAVAASVHRAFTARAALKISCHAILAPASSAPTVLSSRLGSKYTPRAFTRLLRWRTKRPARACQVFSVRMAQQIQPACRAPLDTSVRVAVRMHNLARATRAISARKAVILLWVGHVRQVR